MVLTQNESTISKYQHWLIVAEFQSDEEFNSLVDQLFQNLVEKYNIHTSIESHKALLEEYCNQFKNLIIGETTIFTLNRKIFLLTLSYLENLKFTNSISKLT